MGERCGNCETLFGASTLHYVSASHGGWGIVRVATLVPESHLLFVCPSACGRHNALGSAFYGIKDRVSYLFLTEADIVAGDFERLIVENTDALFEALGRKPRVLFIYTACLDDLLGTDHGPILAALSERHPDVRFRHCTMNPIALDSRLPPGITTNINMFSLLEKRETRRDLVNVLGSPVSFSPDCDLKKLLGKKGYTVLNIADCKRFEEFLVMGEARLNIVSSPIAVKAAQELEKRLGIPYLKAFVNYDPDEITAFYAALSETLGENLTEAARSYRDAAEEKIRHARETVGNYPIAVDYEAVLRPYTLALMLVRHGFNVGMVASDSVSAFERPALEALKSEAPELLIENPMHHTAVCFPHEGEKYLCIGFDCGYMTGSDKIVNLMEDEGMYGYYGVTRLMEMLEQAFRGKADVRKIIEEAGLII